MKKIFSVLMMAGFIFMNSNSAQAFESTNTVFPGWFGGLKIVHIIPQRLFPGLWAKQAVIKDNLYVLRPIQLSDFELNRYSHISA